MSYIAFNNILLKMMIRILVDEDNVFMNAGHKIKFVWVSFWLFCGVFYVFIKEVHL